MIESSGAKLLFTQRCPKCKRVGQPGATVCLFCVSRRSTALRLLRRMSCHKNGMILLSLFSMILLASELLRPQIYRLLVDRLEAAAPSSQRNVVLLAVGLLLLALIQQVAGAGRAILSARIGLSVTMRLQTETLARIHALSLSLSQSRSTSSIMSILTNDTRQVRGFLVEGVPNLVINCVLVVGIAGAMLYTNLTLGLIAIAPIPAMLYFSKRIWSKVDRQYGAMWSTIENIGRFLQESVRGIHVVRSFGQQLREVANYSIRLQRLTRHELNIESTTQAFGAALALMLQLSVVGVWYFALSEGPKGSLSLGEVVAFLAYLNLLSTPLRALAQSNEMIARSLTAGARIFELHDLQSVAANETSTSTRGLINNDIKRKQVAAQAVNGLKRFVTGDIEFKNVCFSYESKRPVLQDLSFHVRCGEFVGIVGSSGAGKTTLIGMAGRLLAPTSGSVSIGERDIFSIDSEEFRRSVAFVHQDAPLFSLSIAENIAYGDPSASRIRIVEAAVAANAHSFIMRLRDGYDTLIGEGGQGLSGGEKQRLGIARALLMDPRILILDEATSNIDLAAEEAIQTALGVLMKGRTTLAVAHRISTLQNADRLIVLDRGHIVQIGTHQELVKTNNAFYRTLLRASSTPVYA